MDVVIKVEKFLFKQGNRVGKAAIEFKGDNILSGFHLMGFTICDDGQKIYVMMPAAVTKKEGEKPHSFYFLRTNNPDLLDKLQDAILDEFDSMGAKGFSNSPRINQSQLAVTEPAKD
jgi:hypothetical protein